MGSIVVPRIHELWSPAGKLCQGRRSYEDGRTHGQPARRLKHQALKITVTEGLSRNTISPFLFAGKGLIFMPLWCVIALQNRVTVEVSAALSREPFLYGKTPPSLNFSSELRLQPFGNSCFLPQKKNRIFRGHIVTFFFLLPIFSLCITIGTL